VVALGLVGVRRRERRERAAQHVGLAAVAREPVGVARAGVRLRQERAAQARVLRAVAPGELLGPRIVSSKSFTSNTSARSGEA
jgi:hypothetical protein